MPAIPTAAPGTCFRFTVASAEQAATLIRKQLGQHARVLSVRTIAPGGLTGLFRSPKLEVIAQIEAPAAEESAPAPAPGALAVDARTEAVDQARARFRLRAESLGSLLRRSGFSAAILHRLESSPAWDKLNELPLHRALVETGRHLRDIGNSRREAAPLGRAAFLGTAGVGRTTALCKWLSAEVFRRGRIGHVVTAEFDRPNLAGPLPVFCEALGVPLVHFPASTRPATPGGFVYVDLPGLSLGRPSENSAIAGFLDREEIAQRVLVLNAAYAPDALRAAYAAGRDLGATHVVFTHLDELAQWGRLWDYLLDGELEPLFLGTGPSLTGDCEEHPLEAVARRTLPAPETVDEFPADETEAETTTLNSAA